MEKTWYKAPLPALAHPQPNPPTKLFIKMLLDNCHCGLFAVIYGQHIFVETFKRPPSGFATEFALIVRGEDVLAPH